MNTRVPEEYRHPDVGAYCCLYIHSLPCEMGRCRNLLSFYIKPGDNPDWKWAQRLMPNVYVEDGPIEAVIDVEESGACPQPGEWPRWDCEIRLGGSIFRTKIPAKDLVTLQTMLDDIGGGLRRAGAPPPTWFERMLLYARWFWNRRPTVRYRTPIDAMNR